MSTLDISEVVIDHLITHHVGNKMRDENYELSETESDILPETTEHLNSYFLSPIKPEEFYCFTHVVELNRNDIYKVVEGIFANHDKFIEASQQVAKLLYEHSEHPKIEAGELNIVYFSNLTLDEEPTDAIGIFKSETISPFLKMNPKKGKFQINHDFGFEIKGIDKGCLIFNLDSETGYKVLITGASGKAKEAQYWKDDFLKLKPLNNEFYQTKQFLGIAKNFVTEQLTEEFEVTRPDQIDLLNRSMDYFKKNESFNKKEFEDEVFQNAKLIKSFRKYEEAFSNENDITLPENFEISDSAVRKQKRVYKSVLKLDKNFHVYIHGNREMIEQGTDSDGRKYYKLYFENEE